MNKINLKKAAGFATEVGLASLMMSHLAMAAAPTSLTNGVTSAQPTGAPTTLFGGGSLFTNIANALLFLIGAVAVIMLIIGGLRYVLSSGNASAIEGAKNTILYAIIGLIVAAAAFAIVNFVLGKI